MNLRVVYQNFNTYFNLTILSSSFYLSLSFIYGIIDCFFIAKAKAFFIDKRAASEFNLVLILIILDPLLIFD